MPAHAGRLRPLERCVFTLVFAMMASLAVGVAFTATTAQGRPATPWTVQRSNVGSQTPSARSGHAGSTTRSKAPSPQLLSAALAGALRPVVGADPGQLGVGVVDLNSGAAAAYNARVVIRGGAIVTTDILAALLLQHQQAGTRMSEHEAELAADMMANNSTAATNQLWSLIGGAPGLAAANATLKLRDTSVTAGANWTWSMTTVADQLQLLADFAAPRSPLDPAARDYAIGLMIRVSVPQSWGVLSAATTGTTGAVADGSLLGPRWVIGSIGVIWRQGHELLVAVLSDHNPAQGRAVSAAQAAVQAAVTTVG